MGEVGAGEEVGGEGLGLSEGVIFGPPWQEVGASGRDGIAGAVEGENLQGSLVKGCFLFR